MLLGKQSTEVVLIHVLLKVVHTQSSAALRRIFGGKVYKRGVAYYITNSLATLMLCFDEEFVSERLKLTSKLSVWDKMKKKESKNLFELGGQEENAS